jgi:hypothetical protein
MRTNLKERCDWNARGLCDGCVGLGASRFTQQKQARKYKSAKCTKKRCSISQTTHRKERAPRGCVDGHGLRGRGRSAESEREMRLPRLAGTAKSKEDSCGAFFVGGFSFSRFLLVSSPSLMMTGLSLTLQSSLLLSAPSAEPCRPPCPTAAPGSRRSTRRDARTTTTR